MLNGDRSLIDPDKDQLGYKSISMHIAKAICKMSPPEGLVIGLYGDWGAGKSTVLNFIEEYIGREPVQTNKPIVIRFNPWWFSGREDLARLFLEQLALKLDGGASQCLKKAGKLLKRLANSVAECPVPLNFGGFGVSVKSKEVAMAIGDYLGKKEDIPELKRKISECIDLSKERLVIFVDDIDRLSSEEIRQLFGVIKAIGDFRNVVYLLAFDKKVVTSALGVVQGVSGYDYLEKIVQVPFEIPLPDVYGLRQLLLVGLQRIFENSDEGRFDQVYFGNVLHSGVLHFLQTPRDVVRLLNTLSVTFPAVAEDVNPVDFIAIESLRIFVPQVYENIRSNKDYFVGLGDRDRFAIPSLDKLTEYHDGWINKIDDADRDPVKDLVKRIFPKLESVWGNISHTSEHLKKWRKAYRVCSPDRFEVYFCFGVPDGTMTHAQIQSVLSTLADRDLVCSEIVKFADIRTPVGKTLIPQLFEQMLDHVDEIKKDEAAVLLWALFQIGDDIVKPEDNPKQLFEFSVHLRFAWLFLELFRKMDLVSRYEVLKNAMIDGKALHAMVHIIQIFGPAHGRYITGGRSSDPEIFVTIEQLGELEEISCRKIKDAVHTRDSKIYRWLPSLLPFYQSNVEKAEFEKLSQQILQDQNALLGLLEACTKTVHSSTTGDKVSRESIIFDRKGLGKMIDLGKINEVLEKHFPNLSIEQRKTAEFVVAELKKTENDCDED